MYYFAYGSNMLRQRIEDRLGAVEDRGVGTLSGYKIAFNKASSDGTGKTNIVQEEGQVVLGVVFELTPEQFAELDRSEGGYHRVTISVTIGNNQQEAIAYVANANRVNNALLPTDEYRSFLIDGAIEHQFPDYYVEMIRTLNI